MDLLNKIEALIYVSGNQGITIKKLVDLTGASSAAVRENIIKLKAKYNKQNGAICIIQNGGIIQMAAKKEYNNLIQKFTKANESLLTQTATETLTIIAYNQPITRIEVDDIRGINSSVSIKNLLNFGLIKTNGRADKPGSPDLYITTDLFLKAFGLNNIKDLPPLVDDNNNQDNDTEMFQSMDLLEDNDNE